MICFKCEKELLIEDNKQMVGLDIPYINLWFHKECYREISNELNEYLTKNAQKIYNKIEIINMSKHKVNRKK